MFMKKNFRLKYAWILLFFWHGNTVWAQDYFRSKMNGDWSAVTTWESSSNNLNWSNATSPPTSAANTILIQSGHTISITSSVSLDQTIVAGVLELKSGGVINLNNGSGNDIDILLGGWFRILTNSSYATSFVSNGNASIVVETGGKITLGDGTTSTFPGNGFENLATSINNIWKDGSVYEYNSPTTFAASNLIYFPNAVSNETPVFRVTKVTGNPGGTASTTINGVLEVNSSFTFNGNGLKTFRDGITGTVTLTLPPSTNGYTISAPTAILGGTLHLILNNNLRLSNGVRVPLNSNISVAGSQGFLKGAGSFKVDGIIDISDVTISNTFASGGNVTINGTLKTSHPNGLYSPGNIASGTILINNGSTIEYNANGNQDVTSSATLGSPYYNITFSNGGIKALKSATTIHPSGTITITGSSVVVDASNFNLGSTSTNSTNFIMDGGRLILGSTSTQPNMDGIYNITGGIIEYAHNSGIPQTIRNRTYQNIEVTGNNVGNSNGNITLNSGGSFKIKNGGIFTINDNSIIGFTDGSANVIVESGGLFRTGNNKGFNGFTSLLYDNSSIHSNITNISLQSGSTVEYMRNGDQPITNANGLIYSNLTLSGSGNKIAPANVLTILGDLKKTTNSVFIHNNGTVLFNGTSAQNYNSVLPNIVFNNLTNNNTTGLYVNDSLSIYKKFLLGTNSKITLNKDVILKSDIGNTANMAPIPVTATINYVTINGRFIVERFIPAHSKAWQLLSTPTKGSTIRDSWQEGNTSGNNSKPGYGTTITSNRISWLADGFDLYSAGGPSMKTYESLTNKWIGINSTFNSIESEKGYMLFVRGDRSVTAYNQSSTATTLRTRGKLYAPGIEAPPTIIVPANSFASVSNPYASAIDFEKVYAVSMGISHSYIIWDPQLTTSGFSAYGYGGFRTISGNVVVPQSGNYWDGSIPPIQSGQAFFVQTIGATPGTVSFNENCKVSGSTSVFRIGKTLTEPLAQLRSNLFVNHNGSLILIDGTLSQFHPDYAAHLDSLDAIKMGNAGENMGIESNGKTLAIERRPLPTITDTLFYNLNQLSKQPYLLEFIAIKLDAAGVEAFLEDNYLHAQTILNRAGTTLIHFTKDSVPDSYAPNRFHIVFKQAARALPVTFTNVKAYTKNEDVVVEWKVENEKEIVNYILETSLDGSDFHTTAMVTMNSNLSGIYQWLDVSPIAGNHYYRVKINERNGITEYSQIMKVYIDNEKSSFRTYPNPVKNGIINLYFKNQPAGWYHFRLYNSVSHLILFKKINHAGGSRSQILLLNKNTKHGVYHLKIVKPDGEEVVEKIVF
jgi:hypothetical protein